MNDAAFGPKELALAVSGLAGILGFVLPVMFAAWVKLLFKWVDADRSGLTGGGQFTGLPMLWATALSAVCVFFSFMLLQAAGQLRQVQVEAPVFAQTASGLVIGVCFWGVYALALAALRKDWERDRQRRRSGATAGGLR